MTKAEFEKLKWRETAHLALEKWYQTCYYCEQIQANMIICVGRDEAGFATDKQKRIIICDNKEFKTPKALLDYINEKEKQKK